ncbi:MAG: hypothetical protein QXT31_05025 [Candidatus Bathyarchaeia archaeon]
MQLDVFFSELWVRIADLLPRIAGVIVILVIGWVAGRAIGKIVSKVFEKLGIESAFKKTAIGRTLEKTGVPTGRLFDLLSRWFVYVIAILAAVDVLRIEALSIFIKEVVQYIPSLIAGIFVLIVGLLVADFIGDTIFAVGKEAKIEFVGFFSVIIRTILYLVVIVIALTLMKIDVSILYIFANALAWGMAIGIGMALGIALGLGLKDYVAKNAESWFRGISEAAKKAEDFWSWYARKEEK